MDESNISKLEFDAIKFFEAQSDYSEKISKVNRAVNDELAAVKEKYKDLLEEHDKEQIAIQELTNGFNTVWAVKLSDYHSELDAIKTEYNKILKIMPKPQVFDAITL